MLSPILILLLFVAAVSHAQATLGLAQSTVKPAIFGAAATDDLTGKSRRLQQSGSCRYGILPGILRMNKEEGSRWQVATSNCKLKNRIKQYVKNARGLPKVSILFLSDSVDHRSLIAYCKRVGGSYSIKEAHHIYNYCKSRTPLILRQVFLPTMTPQTRVILSASYLAGRPYLAGYVAKMQLAKKSFRKEFPGQDPKIVVLGGGLWDLFRWKLEASNLLYPAELSYRKNGLKISAGLQLWWKRQAQGCIRHARRMFPNSKLLWRTYPIPAWDFNTGKTLNVHLNTKAAVVQMREAGVAAAIEEGLEVVDMGQVVEKFKRPQEYLQDLHHPSEPILMEFLNMLLNIAYRG